MHPIRNDIETPLRQSSPIVAYARLSGVPSLGLLQQMRAV